MQLIRQHGGISLQKQLYHLTFDVKLSMQGTSTRRQEHRRCDSTSTGVMREAAGKLPYLCPGVMWFSLGEAEDAVNTFVSESYKMNNIGLKKKRKPKNS